MAGINPLLAGVSDEDIRRIEDHVMCGDQAHDEFDELMHQGYEDAQSIEEFVNGGYFITEGVQDSVTHHSSSARGIAQVRLDYEGDAADA